jgi:putative transposase
MIFHVMNRGVGKMKLFANDGDYEAFERCVEKTLKSCPMRICAYCLMPNHWHFVLWPQRDGELAAFMQKLTVTHVRNWQEHRHRVGYGHVYQGRYKSFPVETDDYFYQVMRYVERNALRAELVPTAEAWRWGSLWRRARRASAERLWLCDGPLPLPRGWRRLVNEPQSEAELEGIRRSVTRGQPLGRPDWARQTAADLGLESTFRSRGRPKQARI